MSGKRFFIIVALLLVVAAVIVRVEMVSRGAGNINESAGGVVAVPTPTVAPPPPPAPQMEVKRPTSTPPKPSASHIPLCRGCIPKLIPSQAFDCVMRGGKWIDDKCMHFGNVGAVRGNDLPGLGSVGSSGMGSGGSSSEPMADKPAEQRDDCRGTKGAS
jgi:hypothetical protein